jgi:hypothetical protein
LDDEQIRNAVLLSYIEEAKLKVWINAKTGIAIKLAIKENEKKADLSVKKLIPEDLHNFLDVLDDNKANQFPESNVWDHKIDMEEGFEPKSFKNYNLTPEEQKELDKFLDENLEKGVTNVSFLLFFFNICSPYVFHFTYPDMSLPAGVHKSPNTCTTCVCLTVNTPFPTV